ncbi:MAG: T9SS type A sorting domain-containing protein [Niastella sp.]|nr:T9SS type A sorting domain-containing protein [Niastella sp.]
MNKLYLVIAFVMLCSLQPALAQHLPCGTVSPSIKEMNAFTERLQQASLKRNARVAGDPVIYIPIKPWLIRKTDGTGWLTEAQVMRGLAAANQYFIKAGFQFYFCGTFGYINNDRFYELHNEDDPLLPTVPGVINLYYTYRAFLGGGEVGGYTYLPSNINNKIAIIYNHADNERTFVHELGHYFGLIHTFETFYGKELVSGANCTTTGDYVCDTPADPGGQPGYTVNNCIYTGTILDPEGRPYNPLLYNAMAFNYCGSDLTKGQHERMRNSYAAALTGLTCSSPAVNAPTNLTGVLNGGQVQLTWTDNATNELGYLIERADSATGDFYSIAFVPANTTTFADEFAPAFHNCKYRIKPVNTPASFSNEVNVNTGLSYCRPHYANKDCTPALYMDDYTISRNGVKLLENLASGCPGDNHSDFTSKTVELVRGFTYDFSIRMGRNPDQTYQKQYTGIFIDFNQDGDWSDAGELVYQGDQSTPFIVNGNFSIPTDAKPGITRMRVRSQDYWDDYPVKDPCERREWGEAEDYTVIILAAAPLAIQSINATSLCVGQTAILTYQTGSSFTTGNIFTAYLSNAAGQFTTETAIGSVTATTGGTITITIPANTPAGNGYKIRLKSSTPAVISDPTTAAITITTLPAVPVITPGGALSFCEGASVILSSSAASGNQWFKDGNTINGATGTTYTATVTGNYTVTVTNAGGCKANSTSTLVTVNALPAVPVIAPGGPVSFCTGGSVVLTSSASSGNQWYKDGVAINGAVNTTYTANASGSYTVRTTNAAGCMATSTALVVTVNALPAVPVITAGGPVSFCSGGNVVLTSSAATGNQWYKDGVAISGAVNTTYTASTTGNYTVIVTNAAGCQASSTALTVTANAIPAVPVITAGGPLIFCTGGNVVLTSSSATGNQWLKDGVAITGAVNATYTANASGSYTVRVTNTAGCIATSAASAITVNAIPAKPTITRNSGELVSSAAAGNQWFMDGNAIAGATANIFRPSASSVFTVQVTQNGCASPLSDSYYFLITAIVDPNAWENKIQVFPNPLQDNLYINNRLNNALKARLYDITGKEIITTQLQPGSHQLSVIKLVKGAYILLLTDLRTNKTHRIKLVKP